MNRRLGIDLSSTVAALADVRETRRGLQLRGFSVFEAEGGIEPIAADIQRARRTHGFPRAAEVVARPGDPRVEAVRRAGCRVEHVITPGEALTRVARLHQRGRPDTGVTAVVSLHVASGAVALVREGRLIVESPLAWSVAATLAGAHSELLRRYTFISELTESLRRVFKAARAKQVGPVTEILTCGSLPDLRSLTMPLAAEFDVEVETLDGTDDIDVRVRGASAQQMRETIAALRLAIAAGKRWHKRGAADFLPAVRLPQLSVATRIAAIGAACALAALVWMRFDRGAAPTRVPVSPRSTAVPHAARPAATQIPTASPAAVTKPPISTRSAPAAAAKPLLVAPGVRINARLQPAPRGIEHPERLLALARAELTPVLQPAAKPTTIVPPARASTAVRTAKAAAPVAPPAPASRAPVPASPAAATAFALPRIPTPPSSGNARRSLEVAPKPTASVARARTEPPTADLSAQQPPPVDSLPAPEGVVVTSILWSSDRQLAIVNGRIVGAGDLVGTETVVEIQQNGVIFRDRGGRLRRVQLRGWAVNPRPEPSY